MMEIRMDCGEMGEKDGCVAVSHRTRAFGSYFEKGRRR